MHAFTYTRARAIDDAVTALNRPGTKILAGGTNLLDLMKGDIEQPTCGPTPITRDSNGSRIGFDPLSAVSTETSQLS